MSKESWKEAWERHKYFFLAIFESIYVLIFIHIPLLFAIIFSMFRVPGDTSFLNHAFVMLSDQYSPDYVMTFVSGLLASSTAYFVAQYHWLKKYTLSILTLVIMSLAVITLSVPLLLYGNSGDYVNDIFAEKYSKLLIISALVIWFFSQLRQKTMEADGSTIRGENAVKSIEHSVKRPS